MAEMLGTCQSAYANLESGKSTLKLDRFLQICDILGVSAHDLIASTTHLKKGESTQKNMAARDGQPEKILQPELKSVYEQMISGLREEVRFLRALVQEKGLS